MSGKRRGLARALGICAVLGGAALGLAPGSAVAAQQSDPNPLSSNVPYLAWRGEHVRIVKCTGDLSEQELAALDGIGENARGGIFPRDLGINLDVNVEDWSGLADFQPTPQAGTIDLFRSGRELCAKADLISQKAGMAIVKFTATLDPGADGKWMDVLTRSEIVTNHQFLVAWLQLNAPTLESLPVGGNAAGTDVFRAGNDPANDGVLRATVTGTLPLGNNFDELGLGPAITLPAAWPALATAMASDRNPDNSAPRWRWDIHDDNTLAEGHVVGTCLGTLLASDSVDNCAGGLAFSRFFDADGPGPLPSINLGLTSPDSIGPFDPQRPNETLLGDGQLTADDAPMPAARIDVAIAANTGGTDINGLGSLHKNDKTTFYSRDRLPTANAGSGSDTAHNLYAPFYSAYIPATADGSYLRNGTPVSGTDGPAQGNNFPGFLVGDGNGGEGDYADVDNTYNYWDIAHVFREAQATNTTCLNRDDRDPIFRQSPSGAQRVAIYSDEHGQAQVNYRPGTGAFFDALGGIRNANGGCDIEGINPLGRSTITAQAVYPYQPTTDITPKVSNPVTLTVRSLFTKFVTEFPKGPGAENSAVRLLVAHAQDVDGSPYADEVVCFSLTDHASIKPYVYDGINSRFLGGYDLAGSTTVSATDNVVCMRTNARGNAAVEVLQSNPTTVDVVTEFMNERIFRDHVINFGAPVPPPIPDPSPNPLPGGGSTVSGPPNSVPSPSTNGAGAPSPAVQQHAAVVIAQALPSTTTAAPAGTKASVKVRFARLVTSAKGKRSLVVRLEGGTSGTIRIKLFNKKGKAIVIKVKTIKSGRNVTISGIVIPKATVRATTKVIG